MKARKESEEIFPAFENEAWDKMEFLLDKHLPLKKEKKKLFFWWFAALIPVVIVRAFCLINEPDSKTQHAAKQTGHLHEINNKPSLTQQTQTPLKVNDINQNKADVSKPNTHAITEKAKETDQLNFNEKNDDKTTYNKPVKSFTFNNEGKLNTETNSLQLSLKIGFKNSTNKFSPHANVRLAPKEKVVVTTERNEAQTSSSNSSITKKENNTLIHEKGTSVTTKENISVKTNSKAVTKNTTAMHNFYFTLTSGLEANGTSLNKTGVITPVYGAGVQYSSGKLFLRTGFLVAKKIYAAKDKDYNRKTGTWMSNFTFDNIDARCRLVEVPISIGYNISNNKKTGLFVTAGTSAYLMKKEDYQFYFKNGSGNDTTRGANFTNNGNHFLSSINLSAGVEKKVTNRLSITAEPTIKIPVSGIGFGKVKVYSTSILVTAKLKLK